MRHANYQWLLFDADGTLFNFDRVEALALEHAFTGCGVVYDPEYLAPFRRIQAELWQAVERGQLTSGQVRVERFERLLAGLALHGGATPAAEQMSALFLRYLAEGAELMDGAREVLAALHGRYRLALVTNGATEVQQPRLELSGLRPYFAGVFISEAVGAAKPSRAYFDAVFTRLAHPPRAAVLMIGDSWSADITGAHAYGLDTCWFNPARRPRPDGIAITYEITGLRELMPLLGIEGGSI
jgi:2-haloacid dehalogenase